MTKEKFNKWKKAAGILFILLVIGYLIVYAIFPSLSKIGIILNLSTGLVGLVIASQVGFDNRPLWMGATLILPQIMLPLMFFRNFTKVERNKKRRAESNIHYMIEDIIRLRQKSTISSLMESGNILNKIVHDLNNWQPLATLVLDDNSDMDIRKEGIRILREIEDDNFVDKIIESLDNSPNPEIRKFVAELITIGDEEAT